MKLVNQVRMLSGLFLIAMNSSCKTLQIEDVPNGKQMMAASAYIISLKAENKLPGIRENDHGTLQSVPLRRNGDVERLSEVTFKATVEGKAGVSYWYRVVRNDPDSQWQIVEAWLNDKEGNHTMLPLP